MGLLTTEQIGELIKERNITTTQDIDDMPIPSRQYKGKAPLRAGHLGYKHVL